MGSLVTKLRPAVGTMAQNPEVQQFIKNTILEDKVVVFSKSYCPYCNMAKEVFNKVKQPFKLIELDQRDDGTTIQENLHSITGMKTVPQVFINGKCVGGGSDVKSLYDQGALQSMLIDKFKDYSRVCNRNIHKVHAYCLRQTQEC